MTTLTADNTSQQCQLPTMTISTPSFTLLISPALKVNARSTKCIFSTSATDLHEIPTRISKCNSNDAMMMNDPLPPPLQAPIPPLWIASHSMPQSLPHPDSNHEYIYKTCLVTVYDAFKHMQQWWPLLVYTTWPTPSTHDATTTSLPLASTINHTSLNTSDSLPSLPCTSAPTNFCEHDLAAFAKELEQMKQYWLPPAKMPQPMSSLPVPSTPAEPLPHECIQQFATNTPSNTSVCITTLPSTTAAPSCNLPEAWKPLTTIPTSTLPCPQQQKSNLHPPPSQPPFTKTAHPWLLLPQYPATP